MTEHVYKKVELVGTSMTSVTDAIEKAIAKASVTIKNLDWFEVGQIRGHIVDGAVAHYQVEIKAGFKVED
ncbi:MULTISPECIES: dodecin [Rhizobium]|uniref:Dodecin flavoprotein n=1 Tax=Rhizobium wenxiniae TaxID=1737357 RepID=A0A7W9YD17_9HYPH|nr:dodecin [Rhizobium wenxiniae]MBB6166162.1 hypothetical protein [Rhizobium wenxiniae]GGG21721.1 hypothetical protein GCM10010924_58930 [Rhizobium wenxiniae]